MNGTVPSWNPSLKLLVSIPQSRSFSKETIVRYDRGIIISRFFIICRELSCPDCIGNWNKIRVTLSCFIPMHIWYTLCTIREQFGYRYAETVRWFWAILDAIKGYFRLYPYYLSIALKRMWARVSKVLAVIQNYKAFAWSAIKRLSYCVGLFPVLGNVVHFFDQWCEIKKSLYRLCKDSTGNFHNISRIWLIGTSVQSSTGHLPIAFEAVIMYAIHNLSNEARSLPGSGIILMIWLS